MSVTVIFKYDSDKSTIALFSLHIYYVYFKAYLNMSPSDAKKVNIWMNSAWIWIVIYLLSWWIDLSELVWFLILSCLLYKVEFRKLTSYVVSKGMFACSYHFICRYSASFSLETVTEGAVMKHFCRLVRPLR